MDAILHRLFVGDRADGRVTESIPPIAVLTLIGMLSAFGVIGKFIVG